MSTPPEHPPSPLDLLRDKRAILDTGAGPVAFVFVYAIFGLNTAAAVAVGLGVVLFVERLIRRKPVVNALGGLLGTGLAAFIAVRSGRPEGYFVPRMLDPARVRGRVRRLGADPPAADGLHHRDALPRRPRLAAAAGRCAGR